MFRLALATLAMIPPARTTRKRGLEAQQSEALSPPPKRSRTSIITTTTDLSPTRSRRRASPFMEARAWRRDQNRRQGERCLRKALSRHAQALLQQKRAEMEEWLASTKAAEARVAQWRKEEEEDEQLLQMEEAYQQAVRLQARRDQEREAERRAEKARSDKEAAERAEREAKAKAEEERAHQEAEREARERAHQEARREERERAHQEARREASERAHQEAKRVAEAEAEAKRTAEATAKMAAEAEAKRVKEEEEKAREDRDKRMDDRQRAAREQQRQEAAGFREPASQEHVRLQNHAAHRQAEEARQRLLRGSALSSQSATRSHAKDRSAVPRSGGRTGPKPSPYCRPKRTSDPFSTSAPGQPPLGQVLAPLKSPSGTNTESKRHLVSVMLAATQRAQQLHGALSLQQGMSARSAAVLSSLRQGRPSSAVTPRRAERLAPQSRKMGEEVESLTEAMRKL